LAQQAYSRYIAACSRTNDLNRKQKELE